MIVPIKGTIVSSGDLPLYEWFGIEATAPKSVSQALEKANGEPVTIELNSGGGDLFAGVEIYSLLNAYNGDVTIDVVGIAASAASVIAMARKSRIAPSGMLMIHNVSTHVSGNKEDLSHEVEVLDKADKAVALAYTGKTGLDDETLLQLMADETWFTSKDAVELGFIDEVIPSSETLVNGMARILSATELEDARKSMEHAKSEEALSNELKQIKALGGLYD